MIGHLFECKIEPPKKIAKMLTIKLKTTNEIIIISFKFRGFVDFFIYDTLFRLNFTINISKKQCSPKII